MKSGNYFKEKVGLLKEGSLSQEEIIEGNGLLLRFMGLDFNKTKKWILECALYDKSYKELMEVALKINTFWDPKLSWINAKQFDYKHLMFHQVLDFDLFYRQTVKFVKYYYQWLDE